MSTDRESSRTHLLRAMDHDRFVCQITYRDKNGRRTERVISPIKFIGQDVLALCLCREEPRRFALSRIIKIELQEAASVLMPVEIKELES